MRRCRLKDFEFSQSHTMFWDKLERANYFLEAVIETAGREVDDRTVAYLLNRGAGDGGQWNMFVAIVRKHGLVPKAFMPETESSQRSRPMNANLRTVLRRAAGGLREVARRSPEQARAEKADVLQSIHRMLSMHLGSPPASFVWQWQDRDREFHRDGELRPSSSRSATCRCRWTSTSAWSTTRDPPAGAGAPTPSSTSATWWTRRPSPT